MCGLIGCLQGDAGEICFGGRQSGRQVAAAGIAATAVGNVVVSMVLMLVVMPGKALLQQPPHRVQSLGARASERRWCVRGYMH